MRNREYPIYQQIQTINNEGNNEFIRTGATFNGMSFISLPVILAMYATSDPTLRKYLKEYGNAADSFLADGRLFISEEFLKKNKINLKPPHKSTYHPYQKKKITGAKIPYIISSKVLSKEEKHQFIETKNLQSSVKQMIIKELKQINWDYFITIQTNQKTTQDYWDLTMLKFIDKLGLQLENAEVMAAYATEFNYDQDNKRIININSEHRHIHILLKRNSVSVKIETIKELLLEAMDRKKFSNTEFHLVMYDRSMWATNYLLKQYNISRSNFSIVAPNKELFSRHAAPLGEKLD